MKKIFGLFFVMSVLGACVEPFEPQYIQPTPKSEFENEPHDAKLVDFSTLSPEFLRVRVQAPFEYPNGTLVIDPNARFIYLMEEEGIALRYPIAVGREGFEWSGEATIQRRAQWPAWRPTPDMREENEDLPEIVEGGSDNPLGARALYLYDAQGNDTLYRIHGTTNPASIGTASSSGCIRMFNEHVIDLYNRVPNGTQVVVLPLLLPGEEAEAKPPETFEEYVAWFAKQVRDNAAIDEEVAVEETVATDETAVQ